MKFTLCVGALHLARRYQNIGHTCGQHFIDVGKSGADRNILRQRLLDNLRIFFALHVDTTCYTLRQWITMEPIRNPATFGPGESTARCTVRTATGRDPKCDYTGGNQLVATGSGRRLAGQLLPNSELPVRDFERSETCTRISIASIH